MDGVCERASEGIDICRCVGAYQCCNMFELFVITADAV